MTPYTSNGTVYQISITEPLRSAYMVKNGDGRAANAFLDTLRAKAVAEIKNDLASGKINIPTNLSSIDLQNYRVNLLWERISKLDPRIQFSITQR